MSSRAGRHWPVQLLIAVAVLAGSGCAGQSTVAQAPGAFAPTGSPTTSAPASTAPAAAAVPMSRSRPVRVQIPVIGVDSRTMRLGLKDDGTMQVPPGPFPAGWYTGSPTPGELGPAILVGHVHWNADSGVFADLSRLSRGDEVVVRRADGSTAVFRVIRTKVFSKDAFPTTRIYGDIDHAGLRLITCGGRDRLTGSYEDNVVVFARLA